MSTFRYKGKEVFYTVDGEADKPTLIILNGIMMSHKSWEAFVPSFTRLFRVVRFDMLDQGLSSKLEGETYTQALQVDVLRALLDHLELEKAHLVGISYGGSVALQFAIQHPARVARMVLFNAAAYTTPWLRDVGRGWNRVAGSRDGEAYYHVTIPYIYSHGFYSRENDWMEARKEKLLPIFKDEGFQDAMIRLTNSAESHDVRGRMDAIEAPTLVVAAEDDLLTPPREQQTLLEGIPNAELMTFTDCGHASMYERPALFTASVMGFLSDDRNEYQIS